MDPRTNPYAPGAGTRPPELAGRAQLLERTDIAVARIRDGRSARSFVYYGLRGVGKTVLLHEILKAAEATGVVSVWLEALEDRSLPSLLGPALRSALIRVNREAAAKAAFGKAVGALASFIGSMKVKYSDIEVAIDGEKLVGTADSGDLDVDLTDLITTLGEAASERKTAIVLLIDELQYVPERELAALITALHRASQRQLPITMMAAGLPQLVGQMGDAKSYAERLFEFVQIGSLDATAAREALCVPAMKEDVEFEPAAINLILQETQGYPYFLQEWGKHAWNLAAHSPITMKDAWSATETALADLDTSFFRVRFDRLTRAEKNYVRAMAELGPGPYRSGDIAECLGKSSNAFGPTRDSLIKKGMIYSVAHGDNAFTVPLFDAFLKRTMPDWKRPITKPR
jgi:hypothetical protein